MIESVATAVVVVVAVHCQLLAEWAPIMGASWKLRWRTLGAYNSLETFSRALHTAPPLGSRRRPRGKKGRDEVISYHHQLLNDLLSFHSVARLQPSCSVARSQSAP